MTILHNQSAAPGADSEVSRRLLLIWQDPQTHLFRRVGRLAEKRSGGYVFTYEPNIADEHGFSPIGAFPNFDDVYESPTLSAFFSNRVMSHGRANFDKYLEWVGLESTEPSQLPVELLIRTGGGRATDKFHVVEEPDWGAERFVSRFFVSGLVHVEGSDERVRRLSPGDPLYLRADDGNPVNPLALHLDTPSHEPLGWVPDWLCGELSSASSFGYQLSAEVERVNPDAPAHVRVLCRVTAVGSARV